MGKSKIEWTEKTWNPVTGCTKISAGCKNCYAERMSKRLAGRCGYPAENPFAVTLHRDRLEEPLRWKKPSRVFVCSMADLFHDDVPGDFIARMFRMMTDPRQKHTYIILTKRPQRMRAWFDEVALGGNGFAHWHGAGATLPTSVGFCDNDNWPPKNVWLGVTAENQETADERIPLLLQTPAAVRFVSIEPMLGPVDLTRLLEGEIDALSGDRKTKEGEVFAGGHGLDWVICGGESGPEARPMHPDWARSLRDQCKVAGVPFFFKQWGEWREYNLAVNPKIENMLFSPAAEETVIMQRLGKKHAGRLLDGKEHNEMPGE